LERTHRGKISKQTDCVNFPNWSIESEKQVENSSSDFVVGIISICSLRRSIREPLSCAKQWEIFLVLFGKFSVEMLLFLLRWAGKVARASALGRQRLLRDSGGSLSFPSLVYFMNELHTRTHA